MDKYMNVQHNSSKMMLQFVVSFVSSNKICSLQEGCMSIISKYRGCDQERGTSTDLARVLNTLPLPLTFFLQPPYLAACH